LHRNRYLHLILGRLNSYFFICQSEKPLRFKFSGCKRQIQPWFYMLFSAVSLLKLTIESAKYPSLHSVCYSHYYFFQMFLWVFHTLIVVICLSFRMIVRTLTFGSHLTSRRMWYLSVENYLYDLLFYHEVHQVFVCFFSVFRIVLFD